jgi:hypothetical protein
VPSAARAFLAVCSDARAIRINRQHQTQQIIQCVANAAICQFVSGPTALGDRDDESASAQACQMIGEDLSRNTDLIGQVRWKARRTVQTEQDPGARGVG